MRKDIEQVLKKFEVNTFGNKGNIEQLEQKLSETEEVKYIAPTNAIITTIGTRKVEKLPGVFALTTQRILFAYRAGLSHSFYTCDLSEIKMVNCSGNGLTGGHVEIFTFIKTFDILVKYKKSIIQDIQRTFDETIEQHKQIPSLTVSVVSQGDDIVTQIQKLSYLKDNGIITDEEFSIKKSELLSRM
ncbi:SHOCT domain-containing protein [Konateibacter massiliensis]|uniref:SHOCT domain-containing protein n=1 Tax=Konateibacter massiliensis TaxID=2002841 RepID=UPI000C14E33F|nr:SHOCT domain-containing protein [Konateibacter massiliensis]